MFRKRKTKLLCLGAKMSYNVKKRLATFPTKTSLSWPCSFLLVGEGDDLNQTLRKRNTKLRYLGVKVITLTKDRRRLS
jgi:hypothetical protein